MRKRPGPEGKGLNRDIGIECAILFMVACLFLLFFTPVHTSAQDDPLKLIEKKQKELKEKENKLKREEERLEILRKDLDEKLDRYSKLLVQIEERLKALKKAEDERLEQVVKTYEAMPPEDAAARLNELDVKTATKILSIMKPKKASAVMAAMEPKKVAGFTTRILEMEKKFPTR